MLQEKEILSQIILESPHYTFWKDKNLVYVGCSRSFAKAIGFDSPDDVIGKTDHELPWARKYADEFGFEDMEVIKTGKASHDKKVIFLLNKQEKLKTFLVSKTPLFSGDLVVGVLCNCYDITSDEDRDRRLYKDSIFNISFSEKDKQTYIDNLCHYYESIIACMPGNIYWLDKKCVLMGGNDNLAKMFGLKSRSELVGLTYEMMSKLANWTEGQGDVFKSDEIEVMSTGKAKLNIEEHPIVINGEKKYYLGNKVPLRDKLNNIIGVVGISIDVTEKIKAEKNLIKLKEKALMASRAKSEFIANMSHDLRTPITGMLAMIQDMLNTADQAKLSLDNITFPQDSTVLKNVIETVQCDGQSLMGATDELLQLCNEILEAACLESEEAANNVESFNLKEIIEHNVNLLRPTAQSKKLKLLYDINSNVPTYLSGYRLYLDRVLLNLMSNALKFTKEGFVTVSVIVDKNGNDHKVGDSISIQISVEDTGVGIPTDKFDFIFEYFSRLTPAYDGLYKGAGLGLYTVKRYVKAMNGNIKVKSELNKGSCFILTLPFIISGHSDHIKQSVYYPKPMKSFADEKIFDSQASINTENANAFILVVEDNPLAAIAAKLALKPFNCHIDIAKNGEEAVAMAQQEHYDLVLMDVGLPDFSGIEATKKIRSFSDTNKSQVPIVALTGHANNKEMRQETIDAGMQEVLSKPVQPSALESVLQRYVFTVEAQKSSIYQQPTLTDKTSKALVVIDWESCVRMCNDDPEFTCTMLSMMDNELTNIKAVLAKAYAKRDMQALRAEVHRSRGGVCYLKLPELDKTLKVFHEAVKAVPQSPTHLEKTYKALQQAIDNFKATWVKDFK